MPYIFSKLYIKKIYLILILSVLVFISFHGHISYLNTIEFQSLSGDFIGSAFPRFLSDENLYNITHHNFSQNHIVMVLRLMDIYIGPYQIYSSIFVIFSTIYFFYKIFTFNPISKHHLILFFMMIFLWSSHFNMQATMTYPFLRIEVASQLICIATLIGIQSFYQKKITTSNENMYLFLTFFIIFIFSHVHKGFIFPFLCSLIFFLVSENRTIKIKSIILIFIYCIYIFYIDGFLLNFMNAASDRNISFTEFLIGCSIAFNSTLISTVYEFSLDHNAIYLKLIGGLLGCLTVYFAMQSLRLVALKKLNFVMPLVLLSTTIIYIFLTVYGRYEINDDAINIIGERFWYVGVFQLVGTIQYLYYLKTKIANTVLTIFFISSTIIALDINNLFFHINYYYYKHNILSIFRIINDTEIKYSFFDSEISDGYSFIKKELKENHAEVYSFWGLKHINKIKYPQSLISCQLKNVDSNIIETNIGKIKETSLRTANKHNNYDLLVTWDQKQIKSISYPLKHNQEKTFLHYQYINQENLRMIIYSKNSNNIDAVCEINI